jgi:hypothetical protein
VRANTAARIGLLQADGSVWSIDVNSGGLLTQTGLTLATHYRDRATVEALLSYGNVPYAISSDPSGGPPTIMGPRKPDPGIQHDRVLWPDGDNVVFHYLWRDGDWFVRDSGRYELGSALSRMAWKSLAKELQNALAELALVAGPRETASWIISALGHGGVTLGLLMRFERELVELRRKAADGVSGAQDLADTLNVAHAEFYSTTGLGSEGVAALKRVRGLVTW